MQKKSASGSILVINLEFPPIGGGGSPVAYEISKRFAQQNKVDVITMGYKNLPKKEQKDGITIYRVRCLRAKQTSSNIIEHISFIISAYWFLRSHLKKTTYDIVHCHFFIPTGILALWVKSKFGILICTGKSGHRMLLAKG